MANAFTLIKVTLVFHPNWLNLSRSVRHDGIVAWNFFFGLVCWCHNCAFSYLCQVCHGTCTLAGQTRFLGMSSSGWCIGLQVQTPCGEVTQSSLWSLLRIVISWMQPTIPPSPWQWMICQLSINASIFWIPKAPYWLFIPEWHQISPDLMDSSWFVQ